MKPYRQNTTKLPRRASLIDTESGRSSGSGKKQSTADAKKPWDTFKRELPASVTSPRIAHVRTPSPVASDKKSPVDLAKEWLGVKTYQQIDRLVNGDRGSTGTSESEGTKETKEKSEEAKQPLLASRTEALNSALEMKEITGRKVSSAKIASALLIANLLEKAADKLNHFDSGDAREGTKKKIFESAQHLLKITGPFWHQTKIIGKEKTIRNAVKTLTKHNQRFIDHLNNIITNNLINKKILALAAPVQDSDLSEVCQIKNAIEHQVSLSRSTAQSMAVLFSKAATALSVHFSSLSDDSEGAASTELLLSAAENLQKITKPFWKKWQRDRTIKLQHNDFKKNLLFNLRLPLLDPETNPTQLAEYCLLTSSPSAIPTFRDVPLTDENAMKLAFTPLGLDYHQLYHLFTALDEKESTILELSPARHFQNKTMKLTAALVCLLTKNLQQVIADSIDITQPANCQWMIDAFVRLRTCFAPFITATHTTGSCFWASEQEMDQRSKKLFQDSQQAKLSIAFQIPSDKELHESEEVDSSFFKFIEEGELPVSLDKLEKIIEWKIQCATSSRTSSVKVEEPAALFTQPLQPEQLTAILEVISQQVAEKIGDRKAISISLLRDFTILLKRSRPTVSASSASATATVRPTATAPWVPTEEMLHILNQMTGAKQRLARAIVSEFYQRLKRQFITALSGNASTEEINAILRAISQLDQHQTLIGKKIFTILSSGLSRAINSNVGTFQPVTDISSITDLPIKFWSEDDSLHPCLRNLAQVHRYIIENDHQQLQGILHRCLGLCRQIDPSISDDTFADQHAIDEIRKEMKSHTGDLTPSPRYYLSPSIQTTQLTIGDLCQLSIMERGQSSSITIKTRREDEEGYTTLVKPREYHRAYKNPATGSIIIAYQRGNVAVINQDGIYSRISVEASDEAMSVQEEEAEAEAERVKEGCCIA